MFMSGVGTPTTRSVAFHSESNAHLIQWCFFVNPARGGDQMREFSV